MIVRKITQNDSDSWSQIHNHLPADHLLHSRRFTDHYFNDAQANSSLWGAFHDSALAGIIGIEEIDCTTGESQLRLAVGTNFFSFRPGAGVILYQHWVKQTGWTLTFGGSQDFHNFITNAPNAFRVDIPHFVANRWYDTDNSLSIRNIAKRASNLIRPRNFSLAKRISNHLQEHGWSTPTATPVSQFQTPIQRNEPLSGLRQDVGIDYLNWRYGEAPGIYRLFEIRDNSRLLGNIVLSESTNRIIVAFSQASTSRDALYGSLRAVQEITTSEGSHKEVYLACCNRDLQQKLGQIGFSMATYKRPLVILGASEIIKLPAQLDSWHIDFDIGDNGFRYLFHH
jgi:hypothetical protein